MLGRVVGLIGVSLAIFCIGVVVGILLESRYRKAKQRVVDWTLLDGLLQRLLGPGLREVEAALVERRRLAESLKRVALFWRELRTAEELLRDRATQREGRQRLDGAKRELDELLGMRAPVSGVQVVGEAGGKEAANG